MSTVHLPSRSAAAKAQAAERGCSAQNEYNTQLFESNSIRSCFHTYRFRWLAAKIRSFEWESARIIELGCFDAKSIRVIDRELRISRYLGLDAGWGGGLEAGRRVWADRSEIELRLCREPEEIPVKSGETFDLGIAMETLEHVPPEHLDPYLARMASLVTGYFLVTVPIERGPVFFFKHIVKKALHLRPLNMSWADFVNSTLGRLDRVRREEHLGFDDRVLVRQLAKHFDVIEICGMAPAIRPVHWNFGIGIVCRAKPVALPRGDGGA